jgi:outer membrane protein assembly factor BamB
MVKNGGMLTCLNALSGEPIYREERLGALGDYYSSPIGVGDHVLVASQRGVVTVVKAQANELELAYQIDLGQGIMATPAMVDGNLYLRTTETLYCFGRP